MSRPAIPPRWKWFVAIAVAALAVDQAAKLWARHALVPAQPVPFIDGLWDWRLSFNPGASFDLFVGTSGARVLLSVLAFGAVGAMAWMVSRARDDQRLYAIALGLVAGGAAGNLVDRLVSGVVTDFVVWHWKNRAYWPTFNVADAALLVGVVLLLLSGKTTSPRNRDRASSVTAKSS